MSVNRSFNELSDAFGRSATADWCELSQYVNVSKVPI